MSVSLLRCSLLQQMLNHSSNHDKRVNYAVVSLLGVVSVLGILENFLKTVAAVWVINLALSDFLATLTLPLFTHYVLMGHDWKLGSVFCSVEASIFFLNMFVSSFLLAAISLDRCLLVAKPVWSQSRRTVAAAWKICAVGWLWSAVNTIPYFLFCSVIPKRDERNLCYHNFALYSSPITLETDCKVRQAATAVSKVVLAFVLSPALSSTECSTTRLSRGFTKMVSSVIAAFTLCWAPYHIFCLVEVVAQYMPEKTELVEVGLPISTVFAFLNSLLNPIIYTFSCPNFCTRVRQSLGVLFEGLVEETGPLYLAPGRRRKVSSSSMTPMSLNSLNNPTLLHIHHVSQASLSLSHLT
uniref:G-protein coupled receptors family 1 profile domain-containing protein n=1 Tax=Electrophorus electricus TaxID=8005 RepID=A0AAY5EFN5_ELEEL